MTDRVEVLRTAAQWLQGDAEKAPDCAVALSDAAEELAALRRFHEFFRDNCEALFYNFGMPVIDLYNEASEARRRGLSAGDAGAAE